MWMLTLTFFFSYIYTHTHLYITFIYTALYIHIYKWIQYWTESIVLIIIPKDECLLTIISEASIYCRWWLNWSPQHINLQKIEILECLSVNETSMPHSLRIILERGARMVVGARGRRCLRQSNVLYIWTNSDCDLMNDACTKSSQ